MSILQDYEIIRKEIGEEMYAGVERYLNLHPELLLSDIYYKKDAWDKFEAWYKAEKLDAEYLEKPLIEDITFVISDKEVKIVGSSTLFATERPYKPIEWPLPLYVKVQRMAKAKGIKISYKNHYRKKIVEGWAEYEKACNEIDDLFEKIIDQAKVIEARGLHYGCTNDLELSKLNTLCHERQGFFYGGRIVSKIDGIEKDLRDLEQELSAPDCTLSHIHL